MDVINDPDVDAVWICSPSQYHAEQIKACAANKKHVFCEKPIATELDETVEAINACNEAGVKLMIGLQRRFDENFRRVRMAVERKEVGEPIMIKLCSRDPAPPPASYVKGGGGIFADMGKFGRRITSSQLLLRLFRLFRSHCRHWDLFRLGYSRS